MRTTFTFNRNIRLFVNLFIKFDCEYLNYSVGVLTIIAVSVMVVGAILSARNDLEFSAVGYGWMVANCVFTSLYCLYMRQIGSSLNLPKFGIVYYNNLLSAAMLLPYCLVTSEFHTSIVGSLWNKDFLLPNLFAGLVGFCLNFAALWCVSSTSTITYAIVGTLNKIPIILLGLYLFDVQITEEGITFMTMAMLGGFVYAFSKLPPAVTKSKLVPPQESNNIGNEESNKSPDNNDKDELQMISNIRAKPKTETVSS